MIYREIYIKKDFFLLNTFFVESFVFIIFRKIINIVLTFIPACVRSKILNFLIFIR